MKNFVSSLDLVPEDYIENRRFYDRLTSLRYTINANRNRLATAVAFTSGVLFLISGYKAIGTGQGLFTIALRVLKIGISTLRSSYCTIIPYATMLVRILFIFYLWYTYLSIIGRE